jgi:hypothetical protein
MGRTIKAGARVVFREERRPEPHHPGRQGSGGIEPDDQVPRTAPTLLATNAISVARS